MRKATLYSRAARRRSDGASAWTVGSAQPIPADEFDRGLSALSVACAWIKRLAAGYPRMLQMAASALLALALVTAYSLSRPHPRLLTQADIDGAVRYALSNTPRAAADSARAAAIIAPAVVAVEGFLSPRHAQALAAAAARGGRKHPESPAPGGRDGRKTAPGDAAPGLPDKPLPSDRNNEPEPDAIGSGVVVSESGIIMTALHVVSSTDRWVVVFADGSRSNAALIGSQPENDLAILKAEHVPDEQEAAVLASTAHLHAGDQVIATGFPFGIGPSVSAGVVSGLGRDFDDTKTHRKLTNLIQFDAAVNPGNSGGPLVDRDGEVVGIVTALLNPSAAVFAGVGFAVPIENAAIALGENPL